MNTSYWYLSFRGDRYREVSQLDVGARDLRRELSDRVAGTDWIPPAYEIRGKGTWPDWMAFWVPLLSKDAVSCLRELVAPHCELLPWIREPGHEYALLNVTTTVPRGNWSCEKSSVYGNAYAAADVISVHGIEIPNLFVLEGYRGKTFVSDLVARTSVDCGLRGIAFVHPRIPEMHLPFIHRSLGRKGTGFIRLEDDPAAEGEHLTQ